MVFLACCSEEYEQQQQLLQQQLQQQPEQQGYDVERSNEVGAVQTQGSGVGEEGELVEVGGSGDMTSEEELEEEMEEEEEVGREENGGDGVAMVKVECPLSPTLQTGLSHVSLPGMEEVAATSITPYTISISLPAQD